MKLLKHRKKHCQTRFSAKPLSFTPTGPCMINAVSELSDKKRRLRSFWKTHFSPSWLKMKFVPVPKWIIYVIMVLLTYLHAKSLRLISSEMIPISFSKNKTTKTENFTRMFFTLLNVSCYLRSPQTAISYPNLPNNAWGKELRNFTSRWRYRWQSNPLGRCPQFVLQTPDICVFWMYILACFSI